MDGHYVAPHGGGGDIDHISADGTDEDTWGAKAKPLCGTYQGRTLKEVLHGQNILAMAPELSSATCPRCTTSAPRP